MLSTSDLHFLTIGDIDLVVLLVLLAGAMLFPMIRHIFGAITLVLVFVQFVLGFGIFEPQWGDVPVGI